MLNPLTSGFFAVQLLSHKVMRYLVPVFLIAILAASAVLASRSIFLRIHPRGTDWFLHCGRIGRITRTVGFA